MTWTLTLHPGEWMIAMMLVLIGGKLLQQGGRLYGEGRSWIFDTMMGVACQIILISGTALMLLLQNQ